MLDTTSKLDILCICKVSIENVPIYGGYTELLTQLQYVSGWLSGVYVRLSHSRSWVRVPVG